MEIMNMFDIPYMEFPSKRRTHVMIGQNGAIKGDRFCQGFVELFPGGSVPVNSHEAVESYTILEGYGQIIIEKEVKNVKKGDFVFIESNKEHEVKNIGEGMLLLMFVYSPQIIVDHWRKELSDN